MRHYVIHLNAPAAIPGGDVITRSLAPTAVPGSGYNNKITARNAFAETVKGAVMTFPSFHDPTHLYFITASIIGWKHVFFTPKYINIPLNSLGWLQQQKRILLFAFVIMPSHLHVIIKPVSDSIGIIVQQFGSFTAHELLKKLREDNQKDLLNLFEQKKRTQDMNIVSGRTFKPRMFIQ